MFMTGLFALLAASMWQDADPPPADAVPEVRRVIMRGQLIVRVPVRPRASSRAPQYFNLREGPRCFPSRAIAGAQISGRRTVDFVLANRQRMRVEMDRDCPSLDFYGGFYLNPSDDRLCAERDFIRTRMGGSCRIEKFQLLEPRR